MIRYRQLTDAELAERDGAKPVKLSTVKKQHHRRMKEQPPRKIAKRHAAPATRKP